MTLGIEGNVAHASFGEFDWDPVHDWWKHRSLDIYIRFISATRFVAIENAGTPQEVQWSGSYGPAGY
jgi:hypothetical protein